MSAQPSVTLADWSIVRQSLAQICASYDESDSFFSGMFDRLEELASDLARRQRNWAAERDQSHRELSGEKTALAEVRLEIERERKEALAQQAAEAAAAPDEGLLTEVCRLERERDQMRRGQELLEVELDTVRNRAAELAERLVEHESQVATERAQWTEELKRMRQVVERLAREQAEARQQRGAAQAQSAESTGQRAKVRERSSASGSNGCAASPLSAGVSTGPADPVLGSVVAQFEMMQKDLAERRRRMVAAS